MRTSLRSNTATALLFCLSLGLFTQRTYAKSSIFHSPLVCSREELSLEVSNSESQDISFWTQTEHPFIQEQRWIVPAQGRLRLTGGDFLTQDTPFSVKTFAPLRVQVSCSGQNWDLTTVTNHEREMNPHPSLHGHQYLLNLSPGSNSIQIEYFDAKNTLLGTDKIEFSDYYQSKKAKRTFNRTISSIRYRALGRFQVLYSSEQGPEFIRPGKNPKLHPINSKKYFLVARKESAEESFVIALDDPKMIATAREQITHRQLEKIIVGRIAAQHGNFNRPMTEKLSTPYSWHVYHVDSFADFAHIDCDGTPEFFEERVIEKLGPQGQGRICFWAFRVVRELTTNEVQTGRLQRQRLPVPVSPQQSPAL